MIDGKDELFEWEVSLPALLLFTLMDAQSHRSFLSL